MILFYAPPSPYARKARIVARERDVMDRIEEIFVNPYQDDPRLLAANPAGLVPSLSLDDGTALIDSALICRYLDESAAGPGLLVDGDADCWRVLQHAALGNAIMDFAVAIVVERRRVDTPPSQSAMDRKRNKIQRCLATLPLTSAPLTLGDITTACALTYLDFRLADLNWRAMRPDLAPWLDVIEKRPAFAATQPAEVTA